MENYREIVTKAVIAKGKKTFTSNHVANVKNKPTTILGVWVINHNFNGQKIDGEIHINGNFDVNIWYSYDNDTNTEVYKDTVGYEEIVKMRDRDDEKNSEEIIVRSLKQPNCIKIEIDNDLVKYVIEKEMGIELVGDLKVKIHAEDEEEPWDEIVEEKDDSYINNIDDVNEKFIDETI